MRIKVTPETLIGVSSTIRSMADNLERIGQDLNRALHNLELEGASRHHFENMGQQASSRARQIASQTSEMAKFMHESAERFTRADQQGPSSLNKVTHTWNEYNKNSLSALASLGVVSPFLTTGDKFGENQNLGKGIKFKKKSGTPFVKGKGDAHPVDYNDMKQGRIGTCYFLASLMAIAKFNPDFIQNMIKDNGDGTYTVTFHDSSGKPVEVTVDNTFPKKDKLCGDKDHGSTSEDNKELWPSIMEKAYAKWKGGYDQVDGGFQGRALEELTGQTSTTNTVTNTTKTTVWTQLIDNMNNDRPTAIALMKDDNSLDVYGKHSYMVDRIDEANGLVYVKNPWGHSDPKPLTMDDLVNLDSYISYIDTPTT